MGSRKEKRAAAFKKGSEVRKQEKEQVKTTEAKISKPKPEPKPKRKAPPRFLLFVGNLPYQVTEEEIRDHFKLVNPSAVRLRSDKGIAFLEFAGDHASADMHTALRFHHTLFRKRKINVELSAGGGGNSKVRMEKIREKNAALQEELAERIKNEKQKKQEGAKKKVFEDGKHPSEYSEPTNEPASASQDTQGSNSAAGSTFVHPSRRSNIRA